MSMNEPTIDVGSVEQAAQLLSTHFGQSVSLDTITLLQGDGRFLVLRCTVMPRSSDLPNNVIVKYVNPDLSMDRRMTITQSSRNEQAVLQMLNAVSGSMRYGPAYYTGDHLRGLLILEDLGVHCSLQDVLYGSNLQRASNILRQYGRSLAQMQLATRHRVQVYTDSVQRFGGAPPRDVFGWDVRAHLADIHQCFDALQIEPTTAFDAAIYGLAHVIQDPGSFYALSHCDAGPHNILVVATQPILIDFESACFQHGMVDLVQARMAFPSAGLGRRSVPAVIAQMELAYRDVFVEEIPEVADDQVFGRALVEACAHVVLTLLAELGQGQPAFWVAPSVVTPPSAHQMQRLITYLHAFVDVAETWKQLPAIRTMVERMYTRLIRDWHGIDMLPYYPVFQAVGQD